MLSGLEVCDRNVLAVACSRYLAIGLFGAVLACTQSEQSGESSSGVPDATQEPRDDQDARPTQCFVTRDRDGDGGVRTLDECADAGDVGPFDRYEDCDDGDPTRRYRVRNYIDADGDGYAVWTSDPVWACLAHNLEGLLETAAFVDCDDTDPARQTWAYVDGDGDGHGALGSETVCVGADAVGYTAEATDCNDHDPTIYAGAEGEQPLDETDTDCDGNDFPILRGRRDDAPVPPVTLPAASRCEGAALSLVAVEDFRYCYGAFRLTIANRGSTETGRGWLRLSGYPRLSSDVDLPSLPPGESWTSDIFRGNGPIWFSLSFTAAPGDCAAKDDEGSFRITQSTCE